jgi:alkaline phosphatase D
MDYRNRHAQYKTDGNLQAAHAHCPWLVTWDDHEFDNNYAGNISEESSVDVEQFLKRRAAAYQAYYEHMPLRRRMIPRGPDMDLYRAIPIGRLACFQVLDTRQYRTDQPCGDGSKPPCPETFSPDATLLGDRQEQWLLQSLQDHPAQWNILAQQVMMARVDRIPGEKTGWSMDQWGGYDTARKRLLQQLKDRQIANPTVLTGDIHNNWVNDLHVDFDRPEALPIATEWVGTSISSGGDGKEAAKDRESVMAENSFVKFYNAERGYVLCEVTSKQWRSDYRVVPKVTTPEPECLSRAQFVVASGRPGAQRIE